MVAAVDLELLVSTEQSLWTVRLEAGRTYTLGRSSENDIVVDDSSVSRRHARLTVFVGAVEIQDLGSRNGTSVGDEALPPKTARRLAIGTAVQMGSATLLVQRARRGEARVSTGPRVVVHPSMQRLYTMLERVAPTSLSVLIFGETGVGKEVLAHDLHLLSHRAGGPLLKLNCAALSESTLEAELFGYEKGAFTGAVRTKPGLFEAADGGTLFLDEIGDMPASTQVKILRVLENGEILRMGSVKPIRVDVRICAATHQDLAAAIAAGRFRADLYFRLNGMTFTIPPLRNRRSEILPLARMFADATAARLGRRPPHFSAEITELLEARRWMGNVRELRNVVERAVVLSGQPGGELLAEHFLEDAIVMSPRSKQPPADPFTEEATSPVRDQVDGKLDLASEVKELERARIVAALTSTAGNQSEAARKLGITRAVLLNRMRVYGIPRTRA